MFHIKTARGLSLFHPLCTPRGRMLPRSWGLFRVVAGTLTDCRALCARAVRERPLCLRSRRSGSIPGGPCVVPASRSSAPGVTGPVTIFTIKVWEVSQLFGVDFLQWYAWIGLWAALMHVLLAALNACDLVTLVTRSVAPAAPLGRGGEGGRRAGAGRPWGPGAGGCAGVRVARGWWALDPAFAEGDPPPEFCLTTQHLLRGGWGWGGV